MRELIPYFGSGDDGQTTFFTVDFIGVLQSLSVKGQFR